MLCLGLDPGRDGGGVLALDGQAIAAMRWRPYIKAKVRMYALVCATQGSSAHQTRGLTGPHQVGMALRAWLAPKVVIHGAMMQVGCEAAHIGRNARTGLALSRWGGALVGPIEHWDPTRTASWCEPSEWRKPSFRPKWWKLQAESQGRVANMRVANRLILDRWDPIEHAGIGRDEIDKRQAALAKALFLPMRVAAKQEAEQVMPGLMPGLAALCDKVQGSEHVFDAAGICRWRSLQG